MLGLWRARGRRITQRRPVRARAFCSIHALARMARLGTKNNAGQVPAYPAAALLCAMGVTMDQLSKFSHIRDDARFVCSPPVRRTNLVVVALFVF